MGAAGFRASAVFVEGSGWRKGGTQRGRQARAGLQLRVAVEAGRAGRPPPMLLYLPGVHSGRGLYAGRFPAGPLASPGPVLVVACGGKRGQDVRSVDDLHGQALLREGPGDERRSEEHTSELQSPMYLV